MPAHPIHKRLRSLMPVLVIGGTLLAPSLSGQTTHIESGRTANELLREALAKETAETIANDSYLAWMDRVQKPHGSVTKLMVSTPQGILARTVAINDQPLNNTQRQQEEERIDRLLAPEQMREKAKKQHEDQKHVERLLRALPDAFRCDFSPTQPQDGNLRLECSPNPNFSPPNYESEVLQGMNAQVLINREEQRITRMDGTLFKDVTFGWGFLARLKRGGHVAIEQSKVGDNRWSLTRLELRFDGHLVMIKPLHVEETETCWNYRPVPSMTVAQALQFLRTTPTSPTP